MGILVFECGMKKLHLYSGKIDRAIETSNSRGGTFPNVYMGRHTS